MKMNFNISYNFICEQQFIQKRLAATKSVHQIHSQSIEDELLRHEYIADWVDYIINRCDAIPNDIL
jgi:hypothetical protein